MTEDHLVFLSGDKIHDSAFVELVNNKIHYYYEEQSIVIDHYIEFNDSCASQFKSNNAFSLFAKRERHTGRVYFELSHGKGPYDGLGGVIKFLASTAVCAEKLIIRDGKELYDFLINRYTLHNNVSMLQEKHCVMDHQLFFIKEEEMDSFRNSLENNPFTVLKIKILVLSVKMSGRIVFWSDMSCSYFPKFGWT